MRQLVTSCDIQLPWLGPVAVSEFDTVIDEHGRFGLGAVLIIERSGTLKVHLVRKSARPGFEGNEQFAFPGGMIRSYDTHTTLSDWIYHLLQERVAAEVNLISRSRSP